MGEPDPDFPWGDRDPEDGYRVGDHVGIIHSDHVSYMFDNPTGVVTEIKKYDEDDGSETHYVVVQIEVAVSPYKLYLIERPTVEP